MTASSNCKVALRCRLGNFMPVQARTRRAFTAANRGDTRASVLPQNAVRPDWEVERVVRRDLGSDHYKKSKKSDDEPPVRRSCGVTVVPFRVEAPTVDPLFGFGLPAVA